jgi:hypothetical protein
MKNGGSQFAQVLGRHFELDSVTHFKLELGYYYSWNWVTVLFALFFLSKRVLGIEAGKRNVTFY